MIDKLIKISNLIRTVGIHKTWNAVYYRLYMYFTRKILNKDFIIKPVLEYKMKLPIDLLIIIFIKHNINSIVFQFYFLGL